MKKFRVTFIKCFTMSGVAIKDSFVFESVDIETAERVCREVSGPNFISVEEVEE